MATGNIRECRVVRADIDVPGIHGYDTYIEYGGYTALRAVLGWEPGRIIQQITASGLTGRGGGGFPTGRKWHTVATSVGTPYVVVNGDESEPGAFKDRELMEKLPHRILEGALIAASAVKAEEVTFFIRGEYPLAFERIRDAVEEAKAAGIVGALVPVSVHLHQSAGAYICGEETALIAALSGERPVPTGKPPYPAVSGLNGRPTLLNNVETFANVPAIVIHGPDWYRGMGLPEAPGTRVFSVSGNVARPGNYEVELGTRLVDLIDGLAGGVPHGHAIKAVIPGGTSAPLLTPDNLAVSLAPEPLRAAGSMLGTASVIVYDETHCMVDLAANMSLFYRDESCGKCTPCRDGTHFLEQLLRRVEEGRGTMKDLDRLRLICDYIPGESLCALGDGAVAPVLSSLTHFRDEYEAHVALGACPVRKRYQVAGQCFPVLHEVPTRPLT